MSPPFGIGHYHGLVGGGPTLSARQEAALRALIDAFLPPLPELQPHHNRRDTTSSSSNDDNHPLCSQKAAETRFWTYRLSSDPAFMGYIKTRLSREQRFSLSLLSTVGGTVWATGRWDGFSLAEWPVPRLAKLVHDALHSRTTISLLGRRGRVRLWHSWKRFLCGSAFMYVTERRQDSECYENPYAWQALEYPGPHILDRARDAQVVTQGLEEIQQALTTSDNFIGPFIGDECDIIVVGSGAGGAMAARVLAQAGYDVVVMDQAPNPLVSNRLLEADSSYALPLLAEGDTDVLIWTGGSIPSLGGATRYGLGICQVLPDHVRQEWVDVFGLKDFALHDASEFEASLAFVMQEIRDYVDKDDETSPFPDARALLNTFLKDSCDKLGYKYEETVLCIKHLGMAGLASLGDRYMGTKRTSLDDLALSPSVRILTNARVEAVRTTKMKGSAFPRATGVDYVSPQTGERKFLSARKCVIVAAGALETPCLLQRSGFKSPHIGQHLRLHPSLTVFGFVQEGDSSSFVAAPSSVLCTELQQGRIGYGATLHTLAPHPGLMAMLLPWDTPQKFKERMLRLKCIVPILCMQRDTSEGCVREKSDGTLNVEYKLNHKDSATMTKVMQAALLLEAAGGATELVSGCFRDPGIVLSGNDTEPLLDEYLRSVKQFGISDSKFNLVSMHQMGSCRMSRSPRTGVVDPNGEVWECNDLYVMDSSLFPTAIGVHPMITVMVMARMLSLRLAAGLKNAQNSDDGSSLAQKNPFLVLRKQYASELQLKVVLKAFTKLIATLLMLIPAILFWWYDLGSPLA